MEFFTDQQTGRMMSIVGSGVNDLNQFPNGSMGRLVNIVVQFFGLAAGMLALNWRLALLALRPGPIMCLLSYKVIETIRPKYTEVRSRFGEMNARMTPTSRASSS